MTQTSRTDLLAEIKELKGALAAALQDREAAWLEQARLMREIARLKTLCPK